MCVRVGSSISSAALAHALTPHIFLAGGVAMIASGLSIQMTSVCVRWHKMALDGTSACQQIKAKLGVGPTTTRWATLVLKTPITKSVSQRW